MPAITLTGLRALAGSAKQAYVVTHIEDQLLSMRLATKRWPDWAGYRIGKEGCLDPMTTAISLAVPPESESLET